MYHSRRKRLSWFFAKCGSIFENGIMWKARSHAANQGYSHLSGFDLQDVVRRELCPGLPLIHRIRPAVHDVLMERVFHKRLTSRITVKTRRIRFVLREERRPVTLVGNLIFAELTVVNMCETVTFQLN